MMVYDNQGTSTLPKYQLWNGSAWGSEASASAVTGEIRHLVVEYCPTRDEAILMVGTSTGQIQMQVWDGSAWGSVTVLATNVDANGSADLESYYRAFDVAYSALGVAYMVVGDGTADPNYYTWDGTTLSGPTDINIPTTGIVNWIELASTLTTDTLGLIILDANVDVFGLRWNGTIWDPMGAGAAWDATGAIATKKSIDVAIETNSGDVMWMWADATSTDQYYRSYSGGALGAVTLLDNAQMGGIGHWVDLAANPTSGSDQIMYGLLDAGADLNTFIWSGTAWSAVHTEHSATTEDIVDMNFDIEFETHSSNANDAWLVWGDSATVSRKLWDGTTSTWGAATTTGDDTAFVTLAAQPNTGAFFAGVYEDDTSATDDIRTMNMTGGTQTWNAISQVWSGPVRRNLGLTLIDIAGSAYTAAVYEQSGYRFYANSDSTDVGSPLAGLNTTATLTSETDPFRLRMLVGVTDRELITNEASLKLQYVDQGSGTCASPSGGTPASYTDVTTSTLISYYNNATPTDGATMTSNVNDPTSGADTVVDQTYEEGNDFTNSVATIGIGEHGNWDFALYPNGASVDATYCFRIVQSSGTVLDTYTEYPSVSLPNSQISFSISDNTIGFGPLTSGGARYATGDQVGSGSETEAHTLAANTNSADGYSIYLDGTTLTNGGATVDAIGASNTSSSVGTEQFGMRGTSTGGDGGVVSPYAAAGFAFDTASLPDLFAQDNNGDFVETTYSLRYLANISTGTEAGDYSTTLRYLIVGQF